MPARAALAALVALVAAAVWLPPGTAGAATVRVAVEAAGVDPAVVVVSPATTVEWRNDDAVTRAPAGEVASPDIAPGDVFRQRFSRFGRLEYRDRANEAYVRVGARSDVTGRVSIRLSPR